MKKSLSSNQVLTSISAKLLTSWPFDDLSQKQHKNLCYYSHFNESREREEVVRRDCILRKVSLLTKESKIIGFKKEYCFLEDKFGNTKSRLFEVLYAVSLSCVG